MENGNWRKRGGPRSLFTFSNYRFPFSIRPSFFVLLDHPHPAAAAAPVYFVHVGFHQQDAAAGALEQVLFRGGVGDAVALEAGALIFDLDLALLRRDLGLDADGLAGVELVAVLDRV